MINIQKNFSLHNLNTFGINVHAAFFSVLEKESQLDDIVNHELFKKGVFILGGGSNILFTKDVNKWVIHNQLKGIEKLKEDEQHVWLQVGSGEIWHEFVMNCVENEYYGVENLALIPGTVGAAPIQNIGAYGVEVKSVVEEVHVYDFETQKTQIFSNQECDFSYRDSIFKKEWKGKGIISSVIFKLSKKENFYIAYGQIKDELKKMMVGKLSIRDIAHAIINIRSSKLPNPREIGNAGSFFKNPEISQTAFLKLQEQFKDIPHYVMGDEIVKIPAAWLIENCGWKGFKKGDYGVHKNQALVLVNYGHAIGKDIQQLSEKIMDSVKMKFNISLEREVQIY